MASFYNLYFLILGVLSSVSCIIFFSVLVWNFLRKRTMGTLLLGITFLSTTLAEIILCVSFFLETYVDAAAITTTIEAMSFTSYLLFAFNIVFIYVFGNRLLLRDNDLIRLVYIVGFTFVLAFPAWLVYKNIFYINDDTLYTALDLVAPNLTIVFPPRSLILLAVMAPLGITAFLRIVFKAISIQRGTEDPVAKKGFQFIWQGTFFWYLGYSGTFGILWFVDIFSENKYLLLALFTFKFVFSDIIGFLLLYIGWIMPPRVKRRFQKKAWIVKAISGEVKIPTTGTASSYVPAQDSAKSEDFTVVEINER